MTSVRKIAILGGGVGAMAAAWELTNRPDWQCYYDITVYEKGWRLGGKGASGRNPKPPHEIMEHGMHLWFGFYANAFWMIRQVYDELPKRSLCPDSPFQSWEDAFLPMNTSTIAEKTGDAWSFRDVDAPTKHGSPGDHDPFVEGEEIPATKWPRTFRMLDWMAHHSFDKIGAWLEAGAPRQERLAILQHVEELAAFIVPKLHDDSGVGVAFVDLILAGLRGILVDDIIHRGFESINDQDYRAWLVKHGAQHADSVLVRNIYDGCFAYIDGDPNQPNIEAGTALNGHIDMFFHYRGSMAYRMCAGMGDTIFAPLYLVLRDRGVKFEFFQNVTNLALSEDRARIERIQIEMQRQVKNPPYEPLFLVKNLPCWPDQEDSSQLVDEAGHATRELVRERDFHDVVLGIPIAVLPHICPELSAASARWKNMIDNVRTVRTQSSQLWLKKTAQELGWTHHGFVCGYVEPFDTYADFSHLIQREQWTAEEGVRHIAYLCNALPHDNDAPGCVQANTDQFLNRDSHRLWPNARTGDEFDFSLIRHRYDRANMEPSELYVLSTVGSSQYRLEPGDSGFDNLFLAGDWTRSELNGGCVEGATMSGRAAARAVRGKHQPAVGLAEAIANPVLPRPGEDRYQHWRRQAEDALPSEHDPIARNAAITMGYLDLYESQRPRFKWAGLAAYASERVGQLLRTFERQPHVPLHEWEESLKRIRAMNSDVYADIAWAHLAFCAGGAAEVEAALQFAPDQHQRWAMMLEGFREIEQDAEDTWQGNNHLLRHEQKVTLQEHYREMDLLSDVTLSLIISIDFSEPAGDHLFTSFISFMVTHRETPNIADFAHRWDWIQRGILPLWRRADAQADEDYAKSFRQKWRARLAELVHHREVSRSYGVRAAPI